MRNIYLIAKREYLATVQSKAFIISLFMIPIFMLGSIFVPVLLKDNVDLTDKRYVILDGTGQLGEALIEAAEQRNEREVYNDDNKQIQPAYKLEIRDIILDGSNQQKLNLSDEVRSRELSGFVEIPAYVISEDSNAGSNQTGVRYYASNSSIDDFRWWLNHEINQQIRKHHLTNLGYEADDLSYIFRHHGVETMELVKADSDGIADEAQKVNELIAFGVPVGLMMLMFAMTMMGASPLMNSVMEEKSQNIVETLLCSATPFEFLFGKILGGVAISLTGSAFYMGGILFVMTNMGFMGYISLSIIPWFIFYQIFAIILVGTSMATIGAMCNDAKESQNFVFPALLPLMIPLFLITPVIREPMSQFAMVASLIPPFTPMLMMFRQNLIDGIPLWQPIAGVTGMILYSVFAVWLGSRIFRMTILTKGKTPSLLTVIKWGLRG